MQAPVARFRRAYSRNAECSADCTASAVISDQGKPGRAVVVRAWPGHRNIGRGSCRSALADGVERRSTAVVLG